MRVESLELPADGSEEASPRSEEPSVRSEEMRA